MSIHSSNLSAQYSKVLEVSGADAQKFLQGQVTCDVTNTPGYGAYCDIKGKVLCFFRITHEHEKFLLSMPDNMLEFALRELQKYILRSKVTMQIVAYASDRSDAQEILSNIPEIYPATSGLFFPHDLNLPEFGAVSFTKGCYRGQEIVARMEHRGNPKRSLHLFTSANLQLAPASEAKTAENVVGTVVRTCAHNNQTLGLAVINNEYANKPLILD